MIGLGSTKIACAPAAAQVMGWIVHIDPAHHRTLQPQIREASDRQTLTVVNRS